MDPENVGTPTAQEAPVTPTAEAGTPTETTPATAQVESSPVTQATPATPVTGAQTSQSPTPQAPNDPAYWQYIAQQQAAQLQQVQAYYEQQQVMQAVQQMQAKGVPQDQIAQALQGYADARRLEQAQAELAQQRQALQEPAKRVLADQLVKQYSEGDFQIPPDELLKATSPVEMHAIARTMQQMARKANLTKRAVDRVDSVPSEGTGAGRNADWFMKGSASDVMLRAMK